MNKIFLTFCVTVVSCFALSANADCTDYQQMTLSRYAEAGNVESKVETVKINTGPESTTFINLTGSPDLVVMLDNQVVSTDRYGDTYVLNRSLRGASELALDFKGAPVKLGNEIVPIGLYDSQYIRENKNGCLYLVEISEH